jgi:uncharacterized protein with HEPN domain
MRSMPSRLSDPQRWLIDIRHNIYLARRFIDGLSYEAFRDNDMAFYAVTRCLEIISEASRRLPTELKARHPQIPWAGMAGAGNVYHHDYEDVQHRLVWGTVQYRIPALLVMIEQEMTGLQEDKHKPE